MYCTKKFDTTYISHTVLDSTDTQKHDTHKWRKFPKNRFNVNRCCHCNEEIFWANSIDEWILWKKLYFMWQLKTNISLELLHWKNLIYFHFSEFFICLNWKFVQKLTERLSQTKYPVETELSTSLYSTHHLQNIIN